VVEYLGCGRRHGAAFDTHPPSHRLAYDHVLGHGYGHHSVDRAELLQPLRLRDGAWEAVQDEPSAAAAIQVHTLTAATVGFI